CPAWGATYYVSQDGAGAKTGADVDNASAIATFNVGTAPYNDLDDDTVYLLDTFTTGILVPDSGILGAVVTIRGDYAGHPCVIANTTSHSISVNGKSYINIDNLSISSVSVTSPNMAIYLTGVVSNVHFSNISINSSGSGAASSRGIQVSGATTNSSFTDISITGVNNVTIFLYGVGSSGITLTRVSGTGGTGWNISEVSDLTIIDATQTSSTSYGFYLHDSVTGTFTANGLYATGNANFDFYLKNLSFGVGSTISNASSYNSTCWKFQTVNNLTVSKATIDGAYITNPSLSITDGSSHIIFNDLEIKNGLSDAFYVYEASGNPSHDITCNRCVVHDTGNKANTGNGDGFTVHTNAYNINLNYCKAYNMTGTALAMVGATSGNIYNFTAYNNGGDWTGEGGADGNRAGFYFILTGANPTTGTSWTVKNSIGASNYPREVMLDATSKSLVTFDYNLYLEEESTRFATLDGGTNNISWDTYHATYESNSLHSDPKFVSATNFHLQSDSPARGAGVDLKLSKTNPPDIGAEPYAQSVPWVK
ncbi:MAG: hypothetical protein WC451_05460, partial [Patescibacteria group bacterium]